MSVPKFDNRCRTKGGYVWASECDAGQLRYYLDRAAGSTNEKYREQNERDARVLSFWLTWREENPGVQWQGERNRQHVIAALPASWPAVQAWEPRAEAKQEETPAAPGNDDTVPF